MTVSHTLSLDFEGLTLAAGCSFILVSEGNVREIWRLSGRGGSEKAPLWN
jgi:hypothetical protein